jgi:hypothetical protein
VFKGVFYLNFGYCFDPDLIEGGFWRSESCDLS